MKSYKTEVYNIVLFVMRSFEFCVYYYESAYNTRNIRLIIIYSNNKVSTSLYVIFIL